MNQEHVSYALFALSMFKERHGVSIAEDSFDYAVLVKWWLNGSMKVTRAEVAWAESYTLNFTQSLILAGLYDPIRYTYWYATGAGIHRDNLHLYVSKLFVYVFTEYFLKERNL